MRQQERGAADEPTLPTLKKMSLALMSLPPNLIILSLDEAQNCTMTQLMLWITRLGQDSKAIMMGDVSQYDIKKRDSRFLDFIDLIKGVEQVHNFQFEAEDIVRNKFLIDIVNRYEKWKSDTGA